MDDADASDEEAARPAAVRLDVELAESHVEVPNSAPVVPPSLDGAGDETGWV